MCLAGFFMTLSVIGNPDSGIRLQRFQSLGQRLRMFETTFSTHPNPSLSIEKGSRHCKIATTHFLNQQILSGKMEIQTSI